VARDPPRARAERGVLPGSQAHSLVGQARTMHRAGRDGIGRPPGATYATVRLTRRSADPARRARAWPRLIV
jgi:hypothetical protein